jgi:hypothetical protein
MSSDQNETIVEALREVFTPLTVDLPPELEPATVFSLEPKVGE